MVHTLKILVVTTNPNDVEQIRAELDNEAFQLFSLTVSQLLNLNVATGHLECLLLRVETSEAYELQSIPAIMQLLPGLPIIAFGDQWQIPNVVQAIKIGAEEVCEFPGPRGDLNFALKRIMSADRARQRPYHELIPNSILQRLTREEARILHLLVQGRTTKEVGATLDVSIRTVHYRKKEMLRKLGVQNRSEAIELIRLSSG